MHAVLFAVELDQLGLEVGADGSHDPFAPREDLIRERARPVLGRADQVSMEGVDDRTTPANMHEAATWVAKVAFEHGVPREYELRKHTYAELKARGLGAQAAQLVIKKTRDAYTTLKANIRAGNYGRPGSKRRVKAESKPITFRPEAAKPYDDRCLSWNLDARTMSIWTVAGRLKNISFACSPDGLGLPASRKGESDLVERDGMFFLIATVDLPDPAVAESERFLGVDLGIVNIATTSDDEVMAGRGLNRHRKRQLELRRKLQAKGTQSVRQAVAEEPLPQGEATLQERQPHHLDEDRDRG